MLAYRYYPGKNTLFKEELEMPKLGPNDALLMVRAAGVCHSDLHILDGEIPFANHVFTLGHEVCGELIEKGSEVPGWMKKGTLYSVHGPNPCGNCRYCRTGRDNLCDGPNRAYIGLGADGGYAEYIQVPARNLVEVPKNVSPEQAAVATDAVLTPYHALKTLGRVGQGDTVLAIGLGGLGMNGVQIARLLGAHVIACDQRESALDMARQLGADEVLHSQELEAKLKGRKIGVVADFVGKEETMLQAQSLVSPGGIVLAVGLASPQVPFQLLPDVCLEIRVQGSFWGTSVEQAEVLQHISDGRIRPQVDTGELEDIPNWMEELRQGRVRSRMVLIPKAARARAPRAA